MHRDLTVFPPSTVEPPTPTEHEHRVLHLTFGMGIGGTEQVISNLVLASRQVRHSMSVLCLETPVGAFGERLQKAGISVTSATRRPGVDMALARTLRRHLLEERISLIHCHQYTPWVYGVLAALGTGLPIIFTEHGRFYPDQRRVKRRFVNPLLARRTSRITAISRATAEALANNEYLRRERIGVIYNGITAPKVRIEDVHAVRSQLKIPLDAPLLGTIARFDPIKNHSMLLRAFARIVTTQPQAHLLMVGDGPQREHTEALAADLGILNHVTFTGFKPEPMHFLAAMDLFLLPSLSEGTSMTLLEAMALGKPCVVTDVGGNSEIVVDGETGLVTPSEDLDAYSSAIVELLGSTERRKKMAKASRERFERLYTCEQMAAQYAALYDEVFLE
ncbi:MAG: glycosyltransferase [Pseudomonadota bacterium]